MTSDTKRRAWLTRLSGGEALRTETIEGYTYEAPTVGKSFYLTADPLEEGYIRVVNTSPVKQFHKAYTGPTATTAEVETASGSVYLITVERIKA